MIYSGIVLLIIAGAVAIYLFKRKNTKVYTLNSKGDEYELIGKLWLDTRKPTIDLLAFGQYPEDEAVIEIKSRIAQKLFGRLIRIRLRDGAVTHLVEQAGNESYWFRVSTIEEEIEI